MPECSFQSSGKISVTHKELETNPGTLSFQFFSEPAPGVEKA